MLFLRPDLYPWFEKPSSETRVLAFKEAWLNRSFFLARSVGYVACWIGFVATSALGGVIKPQLPWRTFSIPSSRGWAASRRTSPPATA